MWKRRTMIKFSNSEKSTNGVTLLAPCEIGDTAYCVDQLDEELLIEEYTVKALMYDGEKWYTTDDYCTFNEIGTDEAILDEGEALARFRELRDEYMKSGGKI